MKSISTSPLHKLTVPLVAGFALLGASAAIVPHRTTAQPGGRFANPVINRNFPDPSILHDGGFYYAYATNSGGHMPTARSRDLVHWTMLPDAMPVLPPWVKPGRTWAPEVRAITPGSLYAAYFTGWDRSKNTEAVGVATGPTPAGPFASSDKRPLIDQAEQGGCIDPSCFIDDDGSRYLVWKNDGNSRRMDTWLQLQRLSEDGVHLVGSPKKLIKQDQPWEGNLIEAPTLWKHGGKYYLFYSANGYGSCNYAMGYAVADKIEGPYHKPLKTAWVASTPDVCGPGGEDIVTAGDGSTWMAYHEWQDGPHTIRSMNIDPLVWSIEGPRLVGPSHWTQPAPVR